MTETPTVSIYVDAQNIWGCARGAGLKLGLRNARPDYDAIAKRAVKVAAEILGVDWRMLEVAHQRIYATSKKRTHAFETALDRFGYEVNTHILRSDTDEFDWDVAIAVDVMHDCQMHGAPRPDHMVVLVTGDGDFAHLTRKLDGSGISNVVLGYEGSMSSQFNTCVFLEEDTLYT